MNFLNCPITGETILKITPRGLSRTSLYSELWLTLSDKSKMRVAVSKNAKKNLKIKQIEELFEKIKKERKENLKGKLLDTKKKKKHLERIMDLSFTKVEDRSKQILLRK
jgi:hypothetical protein